MIDERLYIQLRENAWRRPLTSAEEEQVRAWLAAHPEDVADWEAESCLNLALERLPDIPVPSNFTSRVLSEARRSGRPAPAAPAWWRRFRWLPRVAFTGLVLGVGLLSYHQVQDSQRRQLIQSVSLVSEVAAVPSPEMLKDFEAIRVLDSAPPADEELLKLMQ